MDYMNALVNELSDQVSTLHKTIPFTKGFDSKFVPVIQSCHTFSNIYPVIMLFCSLFLYLWQLDLTKGLGSSFFMEMKNKLHSWDLSKYSDSKVLLYKRVRKSPRFSLHKNTGVFVDLLCCTSEWAKHLDYYQVKVDKSKLTSVAYSGNADVSKDLKSLLPKQKLNHTTTVHISRVLRREVDCDAHWNCVCVFRTVFTLTPNFFFLLFFRNIFCPQQMFPRLPIQKNIVSKRVLVCHVLN